MLNQCLQAMFVLFSMALLGDAVTAQDRDGDRRSELGVQAETRSTKDG